MTGEIFGPDVPGAALSAGKTKDLAPEFEKEKFDDLIDRKGYRVAWSRAAVCPCKTVTKDSTAPDPNCEFCRLTPGFIYFRPLDYNADDVGEIGDLDFIQKYLIDRPGSPGVVIRGTVHSVEKNEEAYNDIGHWAWGSLRLTTRPENHLTYYDRITFLDSKMPYSQIVHVLATKGPIEPRFPALRVSFCALIETVGSKKTLKVFEFGHHFTLDDQGSLVFKTAFRPAKGARVAIQYDHHPQYLILEHVNGFRDSVARKKDPKARQTPVGNFLPLPIRAVAKLEFLLEKGTGA